MAAGALRVINIANPQSPFEAGYYYVWGSADGVAVSGNYAYVADYWGALRIVNVENPQSPYEVGFYDTPDCADGVAISGSLAYVADDFAGLQIIEFFGAGIEERANGEERRANVVPTVVSGVLELEIGSRQHTAYRAELLDITGRKVLDLKPGANDVCRLAPGVYFIEERRVRGEGRATKVVIQR